MSDDSKAEVVAQHVPTDSENLGAIRAAIGDHHQALDLRENGGDSAWRTIKRIEQILEMPWAQGAEQARRAEKIKAGK